MVRKFRPTPSQILVSGFLFFILIGSILLSLPVSSSTNHPLSFLDALYTATSAVCVTGLVVKDLSTELSFFGQITVMIMIQLGGLGYMTSAIIITIILGKKLGMRDRIMIQQAMSFTSVEGVIGFIKRLLKITILIELVAAIILSARFAFDLGIKQGIYMGIFHSISAFNNAGFSLFPDSLAAYKSDFIVNTVVMLLIFLGGIGFFVFSDIYEYTKKRVYIITIHTKITLVTSILLTVLFAVAIFSFELKNTELAGSVIDLFWVSIFHSVSSRTAGFNTVDLSLFSEATLFVMIIFMYIGASPGSTGGGIKTTTFSTILLSIWSSIRGKKEVTIFRRSVSREIIEKAYLMASLALVTICAFTVMLIAIENKNFFYILFEVVSALSTVGLSVGDGAAHSYSASFSSMGRLIIIFAMFMGRVGPITVFSAMAASAKESRYKLPKGKIIIG